MSVLVVEVFVNIEPERKEKDSCHHRREDSTVRSLQLTWIALLSSSASTQRVHNFRVPPDRLLVIDMSERDQQEHEL